MSGANESSNSELSIPGFIDEFTEERTGFLSRDDATSFFEPLDKLFEPSFDTLPLELQHQALACLDILDYVERRLIGGGGGRS